MRRALRAGGRRGNALIEFALVFPMLFLLFVYVVNFGQFFFAWITVINASRAAAQWAMLGGVSLGDPIQPTDSTLCTMIQGDVYSILGLNAGPPNLLVRNCTRDGATTTCTNPCGGSGSFTDPAADTTAEAGLYVMRWVDVQYKYTPLIKLGVPLPTTIHRKAIMRGLQ